MHATKAEQDTLIQIKKRSEFLKIQNAGRKWVSHGLIIQTRSNNREEKRIGFTVSKKTDKSAVNRNRIKRRLRAVAAEILPAHAKDGQDYILVGRPQTATRSYDSLCKDLKWCLKKLELLNKKPIKEQPNKEESDAWLQNFPDVLFSF